MFWDVVPPGLNVQRLRYRAPVSDNIGNPAGIAVSFTPEALEQTISRHSVSPNASPKHEDVRIDEFYQRLASARNLEQRGQIGREIEQYVLRDQAYMVPLWGLMAQVAFRSYVKGVIPPAFGGHDNFDWATTWLDK